MGEDERIWVLTGDLGYGMWDKVKSALPNRFINTGSAEQLLVDLSIGLKLAGKIPIVYSITPFLLYRPFESLRTYINHEKIGVKLVGSGRNQDYWHDGFSHWAYDDEEHLAALTNIKILKPFDVEECEAVLPEFISCEDPIYLNLRR